MTYDGIMMTDQAKQNLGLSPLLLDDQKGQVAQFDNMASKAWYEHFKGPYTLGIFGLGDVGGTLAIALKTLGSHKIKTLGVFDLNEERKNRYLLELSQIYHQDRHDMEVVALDKTHLYQTDVLIFTASKFVPAVGSQVKDVRMAQFEANAGLITSVVNEALDHGFKGLFCVVSDPVDLLCRVARDVAAKHPTNPLSPLQIKGFGLGVMHARARYYAKTMMMTEFFDAGAVYGPHGKDLVVINHTGSNFDPERSLALKEATITANLRVRDLGFKPYIAPAISSAAYAIIAVLEGQWHHSTVPFGSNYLGVKNRWTSQGVELERRDLNPSALAWIQATLNQMDQDYASLLPV